MKLKNLIAVATIVASAGITQAASVAWSSVAMTFGEQTLKKDTGVTGYLVYLSSGALEDSYTINESFSAESVGTVVASDTDGTNKGSALTGTFQIAQGTYSNGDVFAFVASYTSDGKTYWNISSTVNTLSGLDPSDPTVSPADFSDYSMASTVSETGKASGGSGWTAVPEPSTAALALAGFALLLKRRKA